MLPMKTSPKADDASGLADGCGAGSSPSREVAQLEPRESSSPTLEHDVNSTRGGGADCGIPWAARASVAAADSPRKPWPSESAGNRQPLFGWPQPMTGGGDDAMVHDDDDDSVRCGCRGCCCWWWC